MGFRLKKNSHALKLCKGELWGGSEEPVPRGLQGEILHRKSWLYGGEGCLTAWFTAWEDPEAAVSDIWAGLVLIPAF